MIFKYVSLRYKILMRAVYQSAIFYWIKLCRKYIYQVN